MNPLPEGRARIRAANRIENKPRPLGKRGIARLLGKDERIRNSSNRIRSGGRDDRSGKVERHVVREYERARIVRHRKTILKVDTIGTLSQAQEAAPPLPRPSSKVET